VAAGKNKCGFTLVETILAGTILSGAVLALVVISARSLGGTRLNREYETAGALADRQLTLIDYIGVENFIESGQTEGAFEGYEPVYYWEVTAEYQEIDNLYLVNVTISWVERNRPYSISVETMLNGAGSYIQTQ